MTNDIRQELERMIRLESHDPHSLLGLHQRLDGQQVVRLWRPGAPYLYIEVCGEAREARKIDRHGLFEVEVDRTITWRDYLVYHDDGTKGYDPYAFSASLGETDFYLFNKGVHYQLYEVMGARLTRHEEVQGVRFTVWAPNAKRVSLVGDFNSWNGRVHPMRGLEASGIWEIFIPGMREGVRYKFEICTQEGHLLTKSDPYGLSQEVRPGNASVVADVGDYPWTDQEWISRRQQEKDHNTPLNIYEVHLGSWRRQNSWFYNYRDLALQLTKYCQEMGFTHVELLPITEHPLDESWGYQTTGYFAATSRFGSPRDFQFFVNYLHGNGIGVILDWVPGHFPMDDFSLRRFDGTALYEHHDEKLGVHPHWQTCIFNYGRHEVSNFLIANALFWCEKMHLDGLRVDAVASMLYLDYGRNPGEWIPNRYGGKENLEAIEFLRHLNSVLHERCPGVLSIAEESTSFPALTQPLEHNGMGFDMKWNMGWMNDTLRYFREDPLFRAYRHNLLTFGLLYAYTERFVLPLSHDEVVHEKASLLSKMPGDSWQKFANLRLLYTYLMCQPGKKLFFMSGEIAQWNEWNCTGEVEWPLLDYPSHQGVQNLVKTMNHLYLKTPPFWEKDFNWTGFEWIALDDSRNSVVAYCRKGNVGQVLCVHNFTPEYHDHYVLTLPGISSLREIFNSDHESFGGTGKSNPNPEILKDSQQHPVGVKICVPPLATCIFELNR